MLSLSGGVFFLVMIFQCHFHSFQIENVTKEVTDQHQILYQHLCWDDKLKHSRCTRPSDSPPLLDWDQDFIKPWIRFENILLVVTYNNPFYDNIGAIEVLYRPFFPHIVYCGYESIPAELNTFNVELLVFKRHRVSGMFMYQCLALAMEKYRHKDTNIKGYLLTADDALIMLPNIATLPKDQIWYFNLSQFWSYDTNTKTTTPDKAIVWYWWLPEYAKMRKLLNTLQTSDDDDIRNCQKRMEKFTGGVNRILGGPLADFFYVPSHFSDAYIKYTALMMEHELFLEIAVPMILYCIQDEKSEPWVNIVNANKIIYLGFQPWDHFIHPNRRWNATYLHPVKWSCLKHEDKQCPDTYCNTILPLIHNKRIERNPNCQLSEVKRDEHYIATRLDDVGRDNITGFL